MEPGRWSIGPPQLHLRRHHGWQIEATLKQAFAVEGPALIEAVIDPHEPPLPGHIQMSQAWNFAKSLLRGEKFAPEIVKTLLENKIKEVV